MEVDPQTAAQLARWKDLTAHLIALVLVIGFFGIVFVAVLGLVKLDNPTTATFIGTTAGYAIGQFSRPLAFYFGAPRGAEPTASGPVGFGERM